MYEINGVTITQELEQKIFNNYLDASYYYFDGNIEDVENNIEEVVSGHKEKLINTYMPYVNGIIVSKDDLFKIISEFKNKYVIDFEIYFHEVLSEMIEKRYNIDSYNDLLSVKNRFGDYKYYNAEKLEYLQEKYGKIKDKDVKTQYKCAVKEANDRRKLELRDGNNIAPNYSFADHIRFKYYLNLFKNQYFLDNQYEYLKGRYENDGFTFMSRIEFFEYKVTVDMRKNDYQRTRRR
ncbi:MAG: hypothetical protein J5634_01990 [Bacilli bacterium]|nr:hypothetical protein [Bacilli bacterium]